MRGTPNVNVRVVGRTRKILVAEIIFTGKTDWGNSCTRCVVFSIEEWAKRNHIGARGGNKTVNVFGNRKQQVKNSMGPGACWVQVTENTARGGMVERNRVGIACIGSRRSVGKSIGKEEGQRRNRKKVKCGRSMYSGRKKAAGGRQHADCQG